MKRGKSRVRGQRGERENHEEANHSLAAGNCFCWQMFRLPTRSRQGKSPAWVSLLHSTASGSTVLSEAFRQEIRKLGWIEGKNITIEYRFTEGKNSRLPELAADLVRLKVDLIVVTGKSAALAAKRATSTIPIVITSSTDPVGAGLVASLARPGGNVTGVSSLEAS